MAADMYGERELLIRRIIFKLIVGVTCLAMAACGGAPNRTAQQQLSDPVGPEITVSPTSLEISFDDQIVGTQSASQTVIISNIGDTSADVTSISIDVSVFRNVSGPAIPTTIAAGSSVSLSIAFIPDLEQSFNGQLIIEIAGLTSRQISLTGTGIPPTGTGIPPTGTFLITTSELPDATVDSEYFANIYTEQATQPIAWRLMAGENLPAGLTIDPNSGRVQGIPMVTGDFVYTVEAEDSSSPRQSTDNQIHLHIGTQTGANCDGITTGLIPIGELGSDFYQGELGGYYPNGSNTRPTSHTIGGTMMNSAIEPLDSQGNPDPVGGVYVLLSIGMSNTTQEFSRFKSIADSDPDKNSHLVIVDGAQSAQSAEVIADPTAEYWSTILTRLMNAGVTQDQVQVVWIKQAISNPIGSLEHYAGSLRDDLGEIVRIVKLKYPNTRVVYLSNRIYGGYATTSLNPEPYAYQSAFANKWIIQQQIEGQSNLNYDQAIGTVVAPWIDWGPDLWADGLDARLDDRLVWTCQDLSDDGTHPSQDGREKVANILLEFFKNDPLTTRWFFESF